MTNVVPALAPVFLRPAHAQDLAALTAATIHDPLRHHAVQEQLLARAGLIATRPGANGGCWLLRDPETIGLDVVLRAVGGCAHLGCPPPGAKGCPVGERIPRAVGAAIKAADQAAAERLSHITVADLLREPELRIAS